MSILYSAFAQRTLSPLSAMDERLDLFVSARNESDRVTGLFGSVQARSKIWFEHSEYNLLSADLAEGVKVIRADESDYVVQMSRLVGALGVGRLGADFRLGVDVTGFMRIQLMVLLRLILDDFKGQLVLYYSDPESYENGPETQFSSGQIVDVVGVPGYEGVHENGPDAKDMLIIGASYDFRIVRRVALSRRSAQHRLVWGLPSLQPHMYAESQLQVAKAREAINGFESERISLYAPAGDPFATAQVLSAHVSHYRGVNPSLNLYLSPTGTKAQVLGFALYALLEQRGHPTTMIYAPSESYSSATATGWARSHRFEISGDIVAQVREESGDAGH